MGYKIEQKRYSPSFDYITEVNIEKNISYVETAVASGSGTGSGTVTMFNTKVKFGSSFTFETSEDYNMQVKIPMSAYEDTIVRLYLTDDSLTKQQYLGTYNIPQYGESKNAFEALMYKSNSSTTENIVTKICLFKQNELTSFTDSNITKENIGTNNIYKESNVLISDYIVAPLIATWDQSSEQSEQQLYYGASLFFRPITTGLTSLLIVIQRDSLDYSLTTTTPTGATGFGRIIELNSNDVNLSTIENLIDGKTVSRLGVHARTGTSLIINGERVRVGRTGYFELNKVLDITSFGVYIPNSDSLTEQEQQNYYFVADYTYLTT